MKKHKQFLSVIAVLVLAFSFMGAKTIRADIEDQQDTEATAQTELAEEEVPDETLPEEPEITDEPEATEPEATVVPEVTATPEPSVTPEVTSAPEATTAPAATATPAPTATAAPTPTVTEKSEELNSFTDHGYIYGDEDWDYDLIPTATPFPSLSPKADPTATPVPTVTPTQGPVPTFDPYATPTATSTPTPTGYPTLYPTVAPSVTPTPDPTTRAQVRAFVERLYTKCLERESDPTGLDFWTDQLLSREITGCDVALLFVFSDEYVNANHTDAEFIHMLYQSFFDRQEDPEGGAFWNGIMNDTAHTRKYIFACFVDSPEWTNICENYGITRGYFNSTEPCDVYVDIANFTQRLYTDVMERAADKDGMDYWTLIMGTFQMSPVEVANEFFESDEFKAKNLNDDSYIEVLYNTCMGRKSDEAGKANWKDKLNKNESTRKDVRDFFLTCDEFKAIMATSGVVEHPMVTIAKTQLGQEGGEPYWRWYGYGYRIEWCACFVSWCADQCGYIQKDIVPKYKWCLDAKAWFEARGEWITDTANYRPKSGDIIFYDWNGNGVIDHTGIVVGTDATGRIHTIEGNVNDVCRNDRELYVGDPDICGYGVPAY